MKINEPDCVKMKRVGAKYVAQLLSQKSREEQLDFWVKRTELLISKQKQKQQINLKSQHIGT